MATLIEASLAVAHQCADVYHGVSTGGTAASLVDNKLNFRKGKFDNGVIWILSGDNAGQWGDVISYSSGTFTLGTTFAHAIVAGVQYAVVPDAGPMNRSVLSQVVNDACRMAGMVYTHDDTVTIVTSQEEYTLPAGVSDVRRVEEATSSVAPFAWEINPYWHENGGILIFHPDHVPENPGNKMRIWYAKEAAAVYDGGAIVWPVRDILWLAVLNMFRYNYITTGKDKEYLDLLYSKAEIENATAMRRIPNPPMRDMYLVGPF